MSIEQIEAIGRAPLATLDALARAVWYDFGAGKLIEAEAAALSDAIEARRRALRRPIQAHAPLLVSVEGRGRTGASDKPRKPGGISARGGPVP